MEDKTLLTVLLACDNNIDEAILKLGSLKLLTEESSTGPSSGQTTPHSAEAQAHTQAQAQAQASTSGPQTPNEWVDALVQQMAAAVDVSDARRRAAGVLSEFERWTARSGQRDADKDLLLAKLQEVSKENFILKRAVQIQNSKLQEKAGAEAEAAQLRTLLGQYQEQVRSLEVANYSLAVHLQQATGGTGGGAEGTSRPPDVY
ncbi:hypothetical protein FOA52_001173 [Chlamydomonas sp. UWO 241]|nr:hypothetical protein FOA52_001173 [Chlamydomonas sp. UWO 241]